MKTIALAAAVLGMAAIAQGATSNWLSREFSKGWNLPGQGDGILLVEKIR
jgi:hypothetical protein